MSTIQALATTQATPEAQATLAAVHSSLGVTPNLFRVAANSPAALNALTGMEGALSKGAGLSDADLAAARGGKAADPHTEAILGLAREIVRQRGAIGPDALGNAKTAGVSDAEIVEIVAHVALNVFTNYLNIVAGTDIDFPVVRAAQLAVV